MKPKKVICPICGKEMIPTNWGMKRKVLRSFANEMVPTRTKNYVNYECPCGCAINYEGETNCWQKCKYKACQGMLDSDMELGLPI